MITLREQTYDQLREAARDERRSVREHAAYLLERQIVKGDRAEPARSPAEPAR